MKLNHLIRRAFEAEQRRFLSRRRAAPIAGPQMLASVPGPVGPGPDANYPVIAVDFDNTITQPGEFQGEDHFHPAKIGAAEGIQQLRDMGFAVVVYTARNHLDKVRGWLTRQGIRVDGVEHKLRAVLYIDDLAIDGKGDWRSILTKAQKKLGQSDAEPERAELSAATEIDQAAKCIEIPTEAQKKSGNYRKAHVTVQGLPITIETGKGQVRSGTDKGGKSWSITMPHHYGYIKRTESEADGDHVDVFIGPDPESELVYIVDQHKPGGDFDEHKCLLGFTNAAAAKAGYLAAYSKDWTGFGGMRCLTMEQFKHWLENGSTAGPVKHKGPFELSAALLSGFDESQHPRDKKGKFIDKEAIEEAYHDVDERRKLLRRLDPENQKKLWEAMKAHHVEEEDEEPDEDSPTDYRHALAHLSEEDQAKLRDAMQRHHAAKWEKSAKEEHEGDEDTNEEEWKEEARDVVPDFDAITHGWNDESAAEENQRLAELDNPYRLVRVAPDPPLTLEEWEEKNSEPEEIIEGDEEPTLADYEAQYQHLYETGGIAGTKDEAIAEGKKQFKKDLAAWKKQQKAGGFAKLHAAWEKERAAVEKANDEWTAKYGDLEVVRDYETVWDIKKVEELKDWPGKEQEEKGQQLAGPVHLASDIAIEGQPSFWQTLKTKWRDLMEALRAEPETAERPAASAIDGYMRGEWLPVQSSNVAAIRYLPEQGELEIEFHNGSFYGYGNISATEAEDFARAPSFGRWVWDHLRRRGTKWGFQKPYWFVSSVSRQQPKWMDTEESRAAHGRIPASGYMLAAEPFDRTIALSLQLRIELAAQHAPKGGITITGKFYRGGQWIPGSVIAHASTEDKMRLEQAKREQQHRLLGRVGQVEHGKMAEQVREHDYGLTDRQMRSAKRTWAALKDHWKGLALHRVQELMDRDLAELQEGASGVRLENLKARLSAYNHMLGWAKEDSLFRDQFAAAERRAANLERVQGKEIAPEIVGEKKGEAQAATEELKEEQPAAAAPKRTRMTFEDGPSDSNEASWQPNLFGPGAESLLRRASGRKRRR